MLKLLLTCEHGGNKIPPAYAQLFEGQEALLATHRGYDIGALDLFRDLQELTPDSFYSEESRLLVELNRSEDQADLLSEITRQLPEEEKKLLLHEYYYPYRKEVEELVQRHIADGHQVLHLSIHSFTPELNGQVRQAEIGLLFDPEREPEQAFCTSWKDALEQQAPNLRVKFNYPYLGTADGFTTYLRQLYLPGKYSGIELEVNQKLALGATEQWQQVKARVKESLQQVFTKYATLWGT